MTANISIITATTSSVVAVPASDIITDTTTTGDIQTSVMVESQTNGQPSGTFVKKPITVGITGDNGYVEIKSGLSDGDIVAKF
jgi:multidrug efflux pump subunit AcrA (membrane-fusion protein)